jgi:hypothetical protein
VSGTFWSPDLPVLPRWTPLVGLRGFPSCSSPSPAGAPRSSSDRGACRLSRAGRPPPHLSCTSLEPKREWFLLARNRAGASCRSPASRHHPPRVPLHRHHRLHPHTRPIAGPSEPRLPASARVPPSWFPTTSTVFSGVRFPACCSRYRTWGSPGCTGVDRPRPEPSRIASRIPSDAHTLRRLLPRR